MNNETNINEDVVYQMEFLEDKVASRQRSYDFIRNNRTSIACNLAIVEDLESIWEELDDMDYVDGKSLKASVNTYFLANRLLSRAELLGDCLDLAISFSFLHNEKAELKKFKLENGLK